MPNSYVHSLYKSITCLTRPALADRLAVAELKLGASFFPLISTKANPHCSNRTIRTDRVSCAVITIFIVQVG
jgi:hypothetical protein